AREAREIPCSTKCRRSAPGPGCGSGDAALSASGDSSLFDDEAFRQRALGQRSRAERNANQCVGPRVGGEIMAASRGQRFDHAGAVLNPPESIAIDLAGAGDAKLSRQARGHARRPRTGASLEPVERVANKDVEAHRARNRVAGESEPKRV